VPHLFFHFIGCSNPPFRNIQTSLRRDWSLKASTALDPGPRGVSISRARFFNGLKRCSAPISRTLFKAVCRYHFAGSTYLRTFPESVSRSLSRHAWHILKILGAFVAFPLGIKRASFTRLFSRTGLRPPYFQYPVVFSLSPALYHGARGENGGPSCCRNVLAR